MVAPEVQIFPSLKGKVAIVTGGSRGIGKAIAWHFAQCGAKVVISYTSESSKPAVEDLIKRIATECNGEAIAVAADLSQIESAQKIVDATIKAFGSKIDVLVNNAGVLNMKTTEETTVEEFDDLFRVNVRAPFLMVKAVGPYLNHPARIINMSSIGARANFAGTSTYMASKAALEGFTRNWAAELGAKGTTVNAVNPGPVPSDMMNNLEKEVIEKLTEVTPVENRVGQPEEIARICAFLAEDRSSWVSGQCIAASGGFQMY